MDLFYVLIMTFQVVIAVITVYIAWQQYKTNKRNAEKELLINLKKTNIELYDKRYDIYLAARKFISILKSKGAYSEDAYWEFRCKKEECVFLFGVEVVDFMNEIINKAERKTEIKDLISDKENPDREKFKNENSVLFNWFCDVKLEPVFMKYLDFKDLTA